MKQLLGIMYWMWCPQGQWGGQFTGRNTRQTVRLYKNNAIWCGTMISADYFSYNHIVWRVLIHLYDSDLPADTMFTLLPNACESAEHWSHIIEQAFPCAFRRPEAVCCHPLLLCILTLTAL